METSALFISRRVAEKECVALLAAFDNTILNKLLILSRIDKDMSKYYMTRYEKIPKIIFKIICEVTNEK